MVEGHLRHVRRGRIKNRIVWEDASFFRSAGKYGQAITNEGLNEITSNWSFQI